MLIGVIGYNAENDVPPVEKSSELRPRFNLGARPPVRGSGSVSIQIDYTAECPCFWREKG